MSNWFGNKRIRYKKNIVKAQEEANDFETKKSFENEEIPSVSEPYAASAMCGTTAWTTPINSMSSRVFFSVTM